MVALGRRLRHDPMSRRFPAPRATERRTVRWTHYGPPLDQGDVGSCTGNAMAQWMNSKPAHYPRRKLLKQEDALRLYSRATELDPWDGNYPPDDTGSSGLAVVKAAREFGYITGFQHAFGIDHMIDTMMFGPVIVGTIWTNDMFEVDGKGFINPNGQLSDSGHEFLVDGVILRGKYFWMLNSWGNWGLKGRAKISFDAMDYLLQQQGDVILPLL